MLERVIAERRWTVDGELPSSTEDKHGVRPIRIILPSIQHLQRPAVFLARAAGQVGTQVADTRGACRGIPPLRQGQAAARCCAAYDALGLRHLFMVKEAWQWVGGRRLGDAGYRPGACSILMAIQPIIAPRLPGRLVDTNVVCWAHRCGMGVRTKERFHASSFTPQRLPGAAADHG